MAGTRLQQSLFEGVNYIIPKIISCNSYKGTRVISAASCIAAPSQCMKTPARAGVVRTSASRMTRKPIRRSDTARTAAFAF